jgi:hypothetical protein
MQAHDESSCEGHGDKDGIDQAQDPEKFEPFILFAIMALQANKLQFCYISDFQRDCIECAALSDLPTPGRDPDLKYLPRLWSP